MAKPNPAARLDIIAVNTARLKRRFIAVPHTVYRAQSAWRAPLNLERQLHLSSHHNPTFEHLRWQAWIAVRDGRDIGRISAQIDSLRAPTPDGETVGYFGMLEAIDDPTVTAALLATAEAWLAERSISRIQGPFNLSINDECGLLIDGFDTPPMMMMPHGQPYYPAQLEAAGYQGAVDMLAYWLELPFTRPPAMRRLLARYQSRITIRPIRRANYEAELDTLRDIFNDAWADNWGFVPITEAEFRDMGATLRLLIADDMVQIAEVDGEPAAFIVALPNLNEAARDMQGRLTPRHIAKLLWRLKIRFPQTIRVPLMGVRQRFQNSALGAALALGIIGAVEQPVVARGARASELSWILAQNHGMRNIIDALGGEPYKTYRIYEKSL